MTSQIKKAAEYRTTCHGDDRWNKKEVITEDNLEEPRHSSRFETKPKYVNSAGEGSLYANLRINGSMRKCLLDLWQSGLDNSCEKDRRTSEKRIIKNLVSC